MPCSVAVGSDSVGMDAIIGGGDTSGADDVGAGDRGTGNRKWDGGTSVKPEKATTKTKTTAARTSQSAYVVEDGIGGLGWHGWFRLAWVVVGING